jgi:hypothetical protein
MRGENYKRQRFRGLVSIQHRGLVSIQEEECVVRTIREKKKYYVSSM